MTDQFDRLVQASATPVVADFWAPWCGPCRMLAPIFHELATELAGRIQFVSINVDEEPALAQRLRIVSIPTLKAFRGGREIGTHIGAGSKDQIRRVLEGWIGAAAADATSAA